MDPWAANTKVIYFEIFLLHASQKNETSPKSRPYTQHIPLRDLILPLVMIFLYLHILSAFDIIIWSAIANRHWSWMSVRSLVGYGLLLASVSTRHSSAGPLDARASRLLQSPSSPS